MPKPSVWTVPRTDAPRGAPRRLQRALLLVAILALTVVMAALRHAGGPMAVAAGPIALVLVPLCYAFVRLEAPPSRPGRAIELPFAF